MALLVLHLFGPAEPRKAPNRWPPCHFFCWDFARPFESLRDRPSRASGTGLSQALLVCNVKNGKVFFIGSKSTTKKVPQKYYELIIVVGKVVQFL